MHQFLEYITAFDPDFASRIEGASASEIERFEDVAGGPFPSDYRVFLELMGRKDDAIFGSDDIVSSAAHLTEFYEHDVRSDEVTIPPNCVVFGISGLSIEELFLDRSDPHRVLQLAGEEDETLWASSFRAFLYQQAFARMARLDHSVVFFSRDAKPRHDRAQRLAEDLDLERQWFSDEVTLCYQSDETRVMVRQFSGHSARVDLSCRSIVRLWRLAIRLSRVLDLPLPPQRGLAPASAKRRALR